MSEGEEPGDLSVAISAGDCIFYESEEENPILPKCLFGWLKSIKRIDNLLQLMHNYTEIQNM